MKQELGHIGAAVTGCRIAEPYANAEEIIRVIKDNTECRLLVFPDLCITGSTCGDLFGQEFLQRASFDALERIRNTCNGTVIAGLPAGRDGILYDCAAVLQSGKLLGLVPLRILQGIRAHICADERIPFGTDLVFRAEGHVFCILTEDALAEETVLPEGADTVVCLDPRPDEPGRKAQAVQSVSLFSRNHQCTVIYVTCSPEESTTDAVYPGRLMIADCGLLYGEAEYTRLPFCLRPDKNGKGSADTVAEMIADPADPYPFLADDPEMRRSQSQEVLNRQARGLYMRLKKTGIRTMVLGVSGGLDSTLALLVCDKVRTLDPSLRIVGVTMPSYGNTSDRTKENALKFMEVLQVESREIPIHDELMVHLRSIGHAEHYQGSGDVVYENAQARIRTLILMDIANMENGLVVGTGDLSELALGWCTYSGDQMSMYGVNGSVPKTQVRAVCRDIADTCGNEALKEVLYAIIDTPISPELTPNIRGKIAQKTEDAVGNYAVNDYCLYWMIGQGKDPKAVLEQACRAFPDYTEEELREHLKRFIRRFFTQQFKRSCAPDGVKAGILSLSPRTDWEMPSDADPAAFLRELDQ
ncbi:MAG: NAD(+) synthase [Solobacterium sp.]|nr:NAD(+) synthase [Solobacterium sp.]